MEQLNFDAYIWTKTMFAHHERRFAYQGQKGSEFIRWQMKFRNELRKLLGLERIASLGQCDFEARLVRLDDFDGYTREKWVIQTEPGFRVPFYLLLPNNACAPLPVVFTVHGHGKTGKELYVGVANNEDERLQIEEGERDIAVQAVYQGYAAVAPDMRAFGELSNPEDYPENKRAYFCRTMQLHAQLFGRTLMGDRVWDIGRIIDFLATREELDLKRIAITGNSGGGAISIYAPAVDERIKVAAPASYFCTFEHSMGSVYHCECNYVPGILTLGEMWDVAGLIAPRPIICISGKEDPIFPVERTKEAFKRLKEIYSAVGAETQCQLYIGNGGHRYYKAPAWDFIKQYL